MEHRFKNDAIEIFNRVFLPYVRKSDYENLILENLDRYANEAFTTKAFNPSLNYEILEQRGDAAFKHFITNYFHWKFPQLQCAKGVAVVSRMIINFSTGENQSRVAEKMGFASLIRRKPEGDKPMIALLEDVFEAFLGLTEEIFETEYGRGSGFVVICAILTPIYDAMDVSLDYERLYDAKTRLKELIDANPSIGRLLYDDDDASQLTKLYLILPDGNRQLLATATGSKKAKGSNSRHQQTSAIALKVLSEKGIRRSPPVVGLTCEA